MRDKRQKYINILIPYYIYDKLKDRYIGPEEKFNEYLWIIIYRYQLLGSNNNQLSTPNILDKMNKEFDLDFECFASSINTSKNYWAILWCWKIFCSSGSFFNLKSLSGTFGFNPPCKKKLWIKVLTKFIRT